MSTPPTERPIRGVNLVLLSGGGEIHIDDISTAAQGQIVLDDIDGSIIAIEDQLATDRGRSDPVWRSKAERALKRKRRQRPALQQRIGELRRAEKRPAQTELVTSHKDAKRKAFIDAAEEMLPRETFVELWARAAEREPSVFAKADGGAA